jgi:hypothetical protein
MLSSGRYAPFSVCPDCVKLTPSSVYSMHALQTTVAISATLRSQWYNSWIATFIANSMQRFVTVGVLIEQFHIA